MLMTRSGSYLVIMTLSADKKGMSWGKRSQSSLVVESLISPGRTTG